MCEFNLNIFNLIIIASIFIGITFGLLLIFTKRINKKANVLLGLVTFIIVFWNIWILSLDFQITNYIPHFYLIPLNYSLALGPLLYLYVKKITNFGYRLSKKDSIHFLPLVLELAIHFMISRDALVNNTIGIETNTYLQLMPVVQFFAIISIVTYCLYALKEIKVYHTWLNKNYSNNDAYSLRWLYRLIIVFAVLWFLWTPYTIIDYVVFNFQLGISDYYPIYAVLSIITIWISAEAFLRPEVILLEANRENSIDKEKPSEEIYKKASWLKEQMVANRFYLNSELTLKSLAESLNMHPNILSKVINDGLDKNFSDFVNEYRVNAIIEKLHSGNYDHITLLGLSFECGFNSKTTFNRVFKNIKGITPLHYKKSIKKDSQ
ncbi:AraC-like DNA-binding protein [Aquimarina sp. EL_43]|uniref:helix-turn-helix domain-containing protein n=1 Tax=Aquimarina TaxID=290174 RepID=UPI00046F652C|nr:MULTISPECIES: AraC family transcriptional regulator [Aquimarina]MBG6129920.1 AraC-like DNA-binding protein [Aquimarina sp. EL_35]MBG6148700.1 AraC-like DNA-binding protein [Aquimarina sp. EL_32]MBG6168926.1 AraC-like DNA-binding protein [Aquimarina sp. EL_43]